uniref:AlwI family type II restriction endonuclease n=1 Tax=uncultured Paracoccus sp. TaxID=189685 RepID=UPI00261FAF57
GTLGLAWVDPGDLVEITPVGRQFLEGDDKAAILAAQSRRYQFWNPSIGATVHQAVRLHPVPFLVRLLQSIGDGITATEYTLFVAKAKRIEDVDKVLDQIEAFRALEPEQQAEIIRQLNAYQIGGTKRGSLINTVRLGRSYAMRMWELSELFDVGDGHRLLLRKGVIRGETRRWIEDYAANGTYIEFGSEKAFFAWMGDPDAKADRQTALDIYTERGDIESAALVKKSLGASTSDLKKFKRMMLSEKTLEDSIEGNFTAFATFVKRPLEFVGRQYETTVGPIDILARDKRTKGYVVIELKKGRAADKVFGQLSRYMGWVKKNLAGNAPVSGMIVGTTIDEKLRAARDAHDTKIDLVTYSSRMSFKVE